MNDIERFKQRLIDKENPPDKTEQAMKLLSDYYDFLQTKNRNFNSINSEDFYEFSKTLIDQEKNTQFSYEVFIIFGQLIENQELIKLGREVLDGSEVMSNLSKRLIEEFGQDFRDEVFQDINVPPLGIDSKAKPEYTKKLISKLHDKVGEDACEAFLAKGLRDSYYEWRKPDRERFLKSQNIDEFLVEKRKRFIKSLEKHEKEGTLFFTQKINKEVLEYVKDRPEIEGGIRKGNILTVSKIPHETVNYLNETDELLKAYYYCHCPWVKESIKDGSVDEIPNVFCNCSGGYYRSYWEIVLDYPVTVKTVKTVLNGDPICEFDVILPDDVVRNLD
ncbi:MAG: hypothetical protein ACTSSN_09600 [Candidatus Heimdallarchaeaceae archaeon]